MDASVFVRFQSIPLRQEGTVVHVGGIAVPIGDQAPLVLDDTELAPRITSARTPMRG